MPFSKSFQLLPESASTFATRLDWLVWFLLIISALLTFAVFALVVYFGIKYRRRSEDEVPPEQKPQRWLELVSSLFLLTLFMVMFFWGVTLYIDMRRPAANAMEIQVVAKQWMWKLQHPGGQREINELHVPVGRPVKLIMTSQDVIHSFGVPAFRIKQDVLPGAYTTQWFNATKTGEYHLFCQEYCGTDHSQMGGRIVVMEEKDYQAWLAGVPSDASPAAAGAKLFATYGCATCHGQQGPTLAGLYGRAVKLDDGSTVVADETYLRDSILNPASQLVAGYPHTMPTYRGQLGDEQVGDLIAYIKSLGVARNDGPSSDSAAPTTRPVNGASPRELPNVPPAREPPAARRSPAGAHSGEPPSEGPSR